MQQQPFLQQGGEDAEVCSETLQIESKIFFCDAKTNTRGLYLKVSEKKANRERSTIIVPGRSLPWFRELFSYYATTDPALVTSKEYPVDSKVFFWSLGANPWGRYLRISENGAGPKGRCHIMVPAGGANAEGWLAFRDVLARIEAYTSRAAPVQVDVQRLMGDVSLGSSPSIGQGMGTLGMGSGMMGQPGMSSMGSAPTPRALVQSSAFASSQSLQNRNLSDLGSYLELLSLARGQDQESGQAGQLQQQLQAQHPAHSVHPQMRAGGPPMQSQASGGPPQQGASQFSMQSQPMTPAQAASRPLQAMAMPPSTLGEPSMGQVSAPLQGQVALLTDAPAELSTTEAGSLLLRTGQKRFFFDTFSNAQGTFFRITEVFGHERVTITVPESAASHFHEAMRLCLGQLPGQSQGQLPGPGQLTGGQQGTQTERH